MKEPQCFTCPCATWQGGLPATRTDPPEPGGYVCGVTEEFIPEGQTPSVDKCQYLEGWLAVPPHPLTTALAKSDFATAAKWLTENVPADVLRAAWPGPSEAYIAGHNEYAATGNIEN